MITMETVVVAGQERASKFIVTGPQQFRAELPACLRDECAAGQLTPCIKPSGHIETVAAWLKHTKTHCHGWHLPKVEAFAAAAAKTHGDKTRAKQHTLPGITPWMRRVSRGSILAPCPSWPVVEDRPLPPPCNCESCTATLSRFGGKS